MALTYSSCSSLYSTLELVVDVQYMEEEEKSAKPPPTIWAKSAPRTTVTTPTSTAVTEGDDATLKDTLLPLFIQSPLLVTLH